MFFIRVVVPIAQHDMHNTLQSKKRNKERTKEPVHKSLIGSSVLFEPIVQTLRRVKPREDASEITYKMFELLKLFSH